MMFYSCGSAFHAFAAAADVITIIITMLAHVTLPAQTPDFTMPNC